MVNYWENVRSNNPDYYFYLVDKGITESRFNAMQPTEMGALYFEYKGIDPKDSNPSRYFIGELPGAVAGTVGGYKQSITTAATAAGRTVRNTAILGLVGVGLVTLIVYREPILKAFSKAGK